MLKTLSLHRHDPFWRHNMIFFIGSMAIAALNYLYYPVLGHVMDVKHFGELQLLLTLLNQAAIVITAFNLVIIIAAASKMSDMTAITDNLQRLALTIMGILCVAIAASASGLKHFFNFDSIWPFVLLGITFIITVPLTFSMAYLQGIKHFGQASAAGVVQAFLKILFSLGLVVAGWRALGAITGIVLAQILSYAYVSRMALKAGYSSGKWISHVLPSRNVIRPQLPLILAALITTVVTSMLYTGDIVAIKRYFSPEEAGLYAGIATVARILFFATISISGVLISSVHFGAPAKENRRTLIRSLLLVGMVGAVGLLLFCIFPTQIVTLLVGERYQPYAYMLPLVSLITFQVSIINILFYYYLALRRLFIVPIAVFGGCVTLAVIVLRHQSIASVLQAFLIGSTLTLLSLMILAMYYGRSSVKAEI